MVSRILTKLNKMAEEHNSRNEFFKLQFNLGHLLTLIGILAVIIPMWINVITDDAQARHSLTDTHTILSKIQEHLGDIDKNITMATIDDDRLKRVQEDVKNIEFRLHEIEVKLR